jgi:hypothetical protein
VHVSGVIDRPVLIVNHGIRSVRTTPARGVRAPAPRPAAAPDAASHRTRDHARRGGGQGPRPRSLPVAAIHVQTAPKPIATAAPPATASIT